MKKILILLCCLAPVMVLGQNWAPSGATWYYSYLKPHVNGYVKIHYIGDTYKAGKMTEMLQKIRYTYNETSGKYNVDTIGYDYTYEESGIVYYYRFGQFFKLYDFNAKVGDSWTVAGRTGTAPCDSIGEIQVDSTGSMMVNSQSLKYKVVSRKDSTHWDLGHKIIESIGSMGYMFPEIVGCMANANEGGPLRCYMDDSLGLYQTHIVSTCNKITGVLLPENPKPLLSIFPNPSNGLVTIAFNSPEKIVEIQITDLMGKVVLREEAAGNSFLKVDGLKCGTYVLSAIGKDGNVFRFKIISMK